MILFLQVCLYVFAGCAVLGMIPASILAARAQQPRMIMAALLVAGFVAFVLVASAGEIR